MKAKILPTRAMSKPVYANLDKLIAEPLAFELLGRTHHLKPVTVEEFYKFANALVEFKNVSENENATQDEIIDSFHLVFASLCDSLTKEDVRKMNQIQIGALFGLLKDHAYGVSHNLTQDELKKKTQAIFET